MSDLTVGRAGATARSSDLYRAVWRWHFYAGLLVLPFMITLAATGALYLFRDEIDAVVHADLKKVAVATNAAPISPSQMISAAEAALGGTAVKYTDPASTAMSVEITVENDTGEKLAVYVDPYTGKVLGSLPDRGTVMWTIRYLHSLKFFGPVARYAIEIAAGWSILLVCTGIYLWWPRNQRGGVVTVRGKPRQRMFWRDTHAVTGVFVGAVIVFLAATGMPWSGFWGDKVNEWANGGNFGYPSGLYVNVPMSGEHMNHLAPTSWSLEQAQVPESSSMDTAMMPVGIDRVVSNVVEAGMTRGFAISLPSGVNGVYTATVYPDDVSRQRVIHLDQYSGEPLIDLSYGDYGAFAKAMEWGINVHLGQQFGRLNQIVLLAACIAIVMLAVSAAVMWWKRRPSGSLGVPPLPSDPRVFRGLLAMLIVGGLIYPLVGVTLMVMLALDWLYTRLSFRRRAA